MSTTQINSDKLARQIELKSLSEAELARLANISVPTVRRALTGAVVRMTTVQAIASALEIQPNLLVQEKGESTYDYDVFISHASEDKDAVVRPLVQSLENSGLRVWVDEHELRVGDSLRRQIDDGLASSRFGIVVLSPDFLDKQWPETELDALVALDTSDATRKVVLPVWHNVDREEVSKKSALIAGKLAANTSEGIDKVARDLFLAITGNSLDPPHTAPPSAVPDRQQSRSHMIPKDQLESEKELALAKLIEGYVNSLAAFLGHVVGLVVLVAICISLNMLSDLLSLFAATVIIITYIVNFSFVASNSTNHRPANLLGKVAIPLQLTYSTLLFMAIFWTPVTAAIAFTSEIGDRRTSPTTKVSTEKTTTDHEKKEAKKKDKELSPNESSKKSSESGFFSALGDFFVFISSAVAIFYVGVLVMGIGVPIVGAFLVWTGGMCVATNKYLTHVDYVDDEFASWRYGLANLLTPFVAILIAYQLLNLIAIWTNTAGG